MILALLLAAALIAALPAPSAPPDILPISMLPLAPQTVLARYTAALAEPHTTPKVVSFEYSIEQTGAKSLQQSHRVFRSGMDQRDEILAVNGQKLVPPTVHVYHKRRNRYAIETLAPRPADYAFHLLGTQQDAHHLDYVFTTHARVAGAFAVARITIDGSTYLPLSISFVTHAHDGSGTITYAPISGYWVPTMAQAHARYDNLGTTERIVFMRYRFPTALPPSTFATPRPATPPPAAS